jgi:hypothetical protein
LPNNHLKGVPRGSELEYSGLIAQLIGVWLKAFELEKLADIERRLSAL